MRRRHANNRGSALLAALVVLAIVGIGVSVVWSRLHITLGQVQQKAESRQAIYLAEGGLEKAVAKLRVQREYAGENGTALGAGRFSVQVSPLGEGRFRLLSTGELTSGATRMARRALEAELTLDASGAVVSYHETRRRGTP